MYTSDTHTSRHRPRASKEDCCTDVPCGPGLRNKYFDGKRLTTDSFRLEQRYLLERRWLLNRAVHGWGVVYGYPVIGTDKGWVNVGPGLILDECGRELLLGGWRRIEIDDLLVLDAKYRSLDPEPAFVAAEQTGGKPGSAPRRTCWLLSAHYAEQSEGPVEIQDPCRCERRDWEHTCETVRFSLRSIPCDECCRDFDCELKCQCGTGPCCESPEAEADRHGRSIADRPLKRGGCRCLCEHLTALPIAECGRLCEVEEPCGVVRVDLGHGVPLACVEVVRDGCDDWKLGEEVDACGPRRLVKRNDLLFDLIRGCDLTHITDFGWAEWHRRQTLVSFDEFSNGLGPVGRDQAEYATNRFWVKFSRAVREETLLPDCFVMTVLSTEREGGWWETRRVPILRIEGETQPDDPAGHVSRARMIVDGGWVEDGVRGPYSLFLGRGTWVGVEIEIRGDLIVDCNGQTVDANPVGLSPYPTGNGTPGGTFVSSFRVAASEPPARGSTYDRAARVKGASS